MGGRDIIVNDGVVGTERASLSTMWADARLPTASKWGIRFGLRWGPMFRPISFTKNPWHDALFTIKLPWFVLPWFAIHYKDYGFYIGGKLFDIGFGTHLCPSASIRRTRLI